MHSPEIPVALNLKKIHTEAIFYHKQSMVPMQPHSLLHRAWNTSKCRSIQILLLLNNGQVKSCLTIHVLVINNAPLKLGTSHIVFNYM